MSLTKIFKSQELFTKVLDTNVLRAKHSQSSITITGIFEIKQKIQTLRFSLLTFSGNYHAISPKPLLVTKTHATNIVPLIPISNF